MVAGNLGQSDAFESNAGDDFHLLWAARRALSLLSPGTDLKGIRLEGPDPKEAGEMDPDGDKLLGIDLTEYLGGIGFAEASVVIHSQLKYSTRRSREAWTAARIAQGKKGKHVGSIAHRLAQVFKAHSDVWPRDDVVRKLRLRLVSNRPCSAELRTALDLAQTALANRPSSANPSKFLAGLDSTTRTELRRLKSGCVMLDTREFCDFVGVIDFSSCGELSRLDHEIALVREFGRLGFLDAKNQYDSLKQFLARRMTPESRTSEVLTADEIVPAFTSIPSVQHLFPAPARFEAPLHPVERSQTAEIIREIVGATRGPVCIHAGAGLGKTTLVRSLAAHLPAGSIVVTFDCYGGGSYLVPSEIRHGHSRAIMQIANELASLSGSALLLNRDLDDPDLLRALFERLDFAARVATATLPGALVVVVVDAADNSVAAADARSERSFVKELLRCPFPDGSRLVVTARTHRVTSLDLPFQARQVELAAFTPEESARNLRRHAATASDSEAEDFHRLSNGVPRVQGYALKGPNDVDGVIQALRPRGKTVEGLIDNAMAEASRRLGDEGFAAAVCPVLLALPRPIPLSYIALLAGKTEQAVSDFSVDMFPGLRTGGGMVSFQDEDFENHLRARFNPDAVAFGRVSDLLRERSGGDAYAAANLADVLHAAGRGEEVVGLVDREGLPAAVKDPVERREVFARRARLAVQSVVSRGDRTELVRLLMVVAETTKTDEAVEDLLLKNTDLASRFGNPATVQRLYLNERNRRVTWHGPTHFLCAANYARNRGTAAEARRHLGSGMAWLREWSALPDDKRSGWHFQRVDVVHAAEAILHLDGFRRAADWVAEWRPPEFAFAAGLQLAREVAARDGQAALPLVEGLRLRADEALAVVDACMSAGIAPPCAVVSHALAAWQRLARMVSSPKGLPGRCGVSLCEAAVLHNLDRKAIGEVLRFFAPPPMEHRLSLFVTEQASVPEEYDTFLRGACLLATLDGRKLRSSDDALLPERLRQVPDPKDHKAKQRWQDERKEFQELYAYLLPAYVCRAERLFPDRVDAAALTDIEAATLSENWEWSLGRRHDAMQTARLKAVTLVDTVLRCPPNPLLALQHIRRRYCEVGWMDMRLALAERIAGTPSLSDLALELIDEVRAYVEKVRLPGREQVDLLVRCCRVAGRIDPEAGRYYFDMAVGAAAEMDQEAFDLLRLAGTLGERALADAPGLNEPGLAATLATVVEDCHWRLENWDHFPWEACVRGLTSMAPGVAAAALCRWDQRGILDLREEVTTFTHRCLERRAIRPETAIAWSAISYSGSEAAMEVALSATGLLPLEPTGCSGRRDTALDLLIDHALRLAPLDCRTRLADQMLGWAKKSHLDAHGTLCPLTELRVFLDGCKATAPPGVPLQNAMPQGVQAPEGEKLAEGQETDWPALVGARTFCQAVEIEEVLRRLQDLHEASGSPFERPVVLVRDFLQRIKAGRMPAEFVPQLRALLAVPPDVLSMYDLEDALKERLRDWDHHPAVRALRKQLPDLLVQGHFALLLDRGGFSAHWLTTWRDELGLPPEDVLEAIIRALPDRVRDLTAVGLYGLAMRLVSELPSGAALDLLRWAVPRFGDRVDNNDLATAPVDVACLPASGLPLEGAVLWYLMGHPDKRHRWRAVHAVRRMVRLGDAGILPELAGWLDRGHVHPLCKPGVPFYWLAARQWFFLLADRLACEAPAALHPIAQVIARGALAPEPPHALVTLWAKRAALQLERHSPGVYEQATVAALQRVFETKASKRGGKKSHAQRLSYRDASRRRFPFDTTDTLPYWYEPLGHLFSLPCDEFIGMAEKWICDKWGFVGSVHEADPVRWWPTRDRDWALRSNRHGSEPTVENLQTYLEFNAMFCVAAELVGTRPLTRDRFMASDWEGWLQRWDLAVSGQWGCDVRGSTPLERQFWVPDSDDAWRRPPSREMLARAVGLACPLRPGYLVVSCHHYRFRYDDSELTEIDSALVSGASAEALLHALQGEASPYHYYMPSESDDDPQGDDLQDEVGGVPLALMGWLRHVSKDSGGVDEHDPFRNGLSHNLALPGSKFCDWAGIAPGDVDVPYPPGVGGESVAVVERWDDCPQHGDDLGFSTTGARLWVRVSDLLAFLKQGGWCLILRCIVSKRLKRHDEADGREGTHVKLYLIHPDGTVETASRNHQAGPAHS